MSSDGFPIIREVCPGSVGNLIHKLPSKPNGSINPHPSFKSYELNIYRLPYLIYDRPKVRMLYYQSLDPGYALPLTCQEVSIRLVLRDELLVHWLEFASLIRIVEKSEANLTIHIDQFYAGIHLTC